MHKIEKKYHFYAGHRNENLKDKCFNLHGHTYYITMVFELPYDKKTGITMLFSEIDKVVKPIIKQLDHSLLIHKQDPLLKYLDMFCEQEGVGLKLYLMDNLTSAENLSRHIFEKVAKKLPIVKILLQETTTSTVSYEINS